MSWWWPFKKREAARAEREFRESLSQALLRQDDLLEATEKLKQSRNREQARRAAEEAAPVDPQKPRVRNG